MLITKTMELLERGMTGSSLRHAALSNNIANANTSGYKRTDVDFQNLLAGQLAQNKGLELKKTKEKHLPVLSDRPNSAMVEQNKHRLRNDGSNVDIDIELAALAENNLYFNSMAQLLNSQLSLLRHAISEGRR